MGSAILGKQGGGCLAVGRMALAAAAWMAAVPAARTAAAAVGGQPVVYAAETSTGYVNVYPADSKTAPVQPIYSFNLDPGTESSLTVDAAGNLFLADPYSTWVFEYAPGATTPTRRFPTDMTPLDTAVDGKTLYVFQAMLSGGISNIAVYEHGSTKPTRHLSHPAIHYPQGMARDGAGNLFVGYGGAKLGQWGVGEFVHGRMPMRRVKLDHSVYPTALAVDAAGNLLVVTPSYSDTRRSVVYVFAPGSTVAARTITTLPDMSQLAFSADGKSFYTADQYGQKFRKFTYPSCKAIYAITDPEAYKRFGFSGVAVSPSLVPGVW
jgi:sugar lactone lactonase YvrE